MPTYDYKCADCGRVFEKFHGMNEQPQVVCPECSSVHTAKQVSLGAGVVFKGAGFYVNDYKKSGSDSGTATTTKPVKDKAAESKTDSTTATPAIASTGHVHGPGCNH